MRDVCNKFASGKIPPKLAPAFNIDDTKVDTPLKSIAKTFVELQEMRHHAHYNTSHRFDRSDALNSHDKAEKAINDWNSVCMTPHADAFLVGLLLEKNIHKDTDISPSISNPIN